MKVFGPGAAPARAGFESGDVVLAVDRSPIPQLRPLEPLLGGGEHLVAVRRADRAFERRLLARIGTGPLVRARLFS